MKSLRLFFISVAILALSIPAQAQEDEDRWRSFEVTIDGGLSFPSGTLKDWSDSLGAKPGFHMGAAGGFYFTDRICTGLYFTYTAMKMEHDWAPDAAEWDRHFRMYDFGAYAKYAFSGESNFEPYLKLSGGYNWPKYPTWVTPEQNRLREQSYNGGFSFAGYLGALYYTSDYGGAFLEVGYQNDFLDGTEADYQGYTYTIDGDPGRIELRAGITVFFGPEE